MPACVDNRLRKDSVNRIRTSADTEHPSRSTERKERISRLPRSTTIPAKEPLSSQLGFVAPCAPLGSTVTELWPSGHTAAGYSSTTGESGAGVRHAATRSRSKGVNRLQLSTTPLIRSSMRLAFSCLITTLRKATATDATKIVEIMLKNAKMTNIFHRTSPQDSVTF